MHNLPTISIIVPVYNVQEYIVTCLESISAQTYQGNIECLIIDDCGKDKSIEYAEDYIAKNQKSNIRFRIIHHKQNKGLSGARNTGIREATGSWLYYFDSDDIITENCITDMIGMVLKHPDTQIVCSGAEATNGQYHYMNYEARANELPEYSDNRNWINWAFLKHEMLAMTAWNKLINRQFVIDNNLFFVEGIINEDEIYHFLMAKHVTNLSILRKNTYIYVVRENSIVTSANKAKSDLNWLTLFDIMLENIGGDYTKKQVSALFFLAHMRVYWSDDLELHKGIKKVLKRLIKFASFKQAIGLYLSYMAPIKKLEKVMSKSMKLVGQVKP